jgi:hypothetical protein
MPPMASPTRSGDPPARLPVSAVDDADWPLQATDGIIRIVDSVRDKTTGPALQAARVVKFGVAALLLLTIVGFLLIIASIRGLEALFIHVFKLEDPIWLVYLILGLVFVGLGSLLWAKAKAVPGTR